MNQNKYNLELKNQFYKNTHTHTHVYIYIYIYKYINLSQMYIFSEQHPRVKHFLLKYIFKQQK